MTSFRRARDLAVCIGFTMMMLSSCVGEQQRQEIGAAAAIDPLYSERPQTWTRDVYLLRLTQPSLLETAPATARNQNAISTFDRSLVDAQQDDVIEQLHLLSEEIEIIYRYRLVFNGLFLVAPLESEDELMQIPGVLDTRYSLEFEEPDVSSNDATMTADYTDLSQFNSVAFIDAQRVRQQLSVTTKGGEEVPVDGTGIRIGVVDTGTDYTHKMFGGGGTVAGYEENDPLVIEPGTFPTGRVVGGYDFVGSDFDSSSINIDDHIPKPDPDPLDERYHGTHVSGTVGGRGDGVDSYDGVAPGADLYALKVFGKAGSTGDYAVIAALEYAADPNGDLDNSDRLDVVNLSLGSNYGVRYTFYDEAVKNLARGGTVPVASAGNGGDYQYIVGSPSTADDFISVANSIDNMQQNWRFAGASFRGGDDELVAVFTEADFTEKIDDVDVNSGELYYIGLANEELTEEQSVQLADRFALVDRGAVTFAEKVTRAYEAGALGVVIVNDRPGGPVGMGGSVDSPIPIVAVMISKDAGDSIKAWLEAGAVTVAFEGDIVEEPERIDSIASSSSRGPRSIDGAIKPEVTAPGTRIISARAGTGDQYTMLSGTSMASPHIAGVAALIRQIHPNATADEIKSLIVNTAHPLYEDQADSLLYPIARQGAGRVQAFAAATASMRFFPSTVSLGVQDSNRFANINYTVTVTNASDLEVTLTLHSELDAALSVTMPSTLVVPPKGEANLTFSFAIDSGDLEAFESEIDGLILVNDGQHDYSLPVLVVARHNSRVRLARIDPNRVVSVHNNSDSAGEVLAFNDLGLDFFDIFAQQAPALFGPCDLVSAGYRVVTRTKTDKDGQQVATQSIQFALQLYQSLTTWRFCEPVVIIDADGDGIEDQELVGTLTSRVSESMETSTGLSYGSFLIDSHRLWALRAEYEKNLDRDTDYGGAVLAYTDFLRFDGSSLAIIEAPVDQLALNKNGQLNIRIGFLSVTTSAKMDFLGCDMAGRWSQLELAQTPFSVVPEILNVPPHEMAELTLTRNGRANGPVTLYYPWNSHAQSVRRIALQF